VNVEAFKESGTMSQEEERIRLLEKCQSIPVLSPGTIQSHGSLIAFNKRSKKIESVSENIDVILGADAAHWLTQTMQPESHPYFGRILQALDAGQVSLLRIDDVDVRISQNESHFLVEFCFAPPVETLGAGAWNIWSRSLLAADSPQSLNGAAIKALYDLIEFDHLMIYRFDDKWNGQVISEWINPVKTEGYEAYLDLCFPESDIPVQARLMYLQHWVRNTADVKAKSIPLQATIEKPLVLASAYLRSVAPSHIQYLTNMGVTASFSLSIIVDGKLWGLLAAHHSEPRPLSLNTMAATEDLAKLYSSLLTLALRKEHQRWLDEHALFLSSPTIAASKGQDALDLNAESLKQICALFDCHSAVVWDGEVKASYGELPSELWLTLLTEALSNKLFVDHIYPTSQLSDAIPDLPVEPIAGLMALSAPVEAGRLLLLLRKEEPQEIQWGGDPRFDAMGIHNGMLSPRNSFKVWKQTLSGYSRPWAESQLILAKTFAGNLIMANAVLGTLESVQKTAKLNLLNMLLHDIGNALSGVAGGTTHLHQQTQDQSALINLKRISDYIEPQLAALDSVLGTGRGVSLFKLLVEIHAAMEASVSGVKQATEWIETSMTHARELLDLQKIYAQSTSHYTRECQVVELLSDAVSVLRTNIDSRGTVVMKLAEKMPALTVDRSKLMQVIINLLKNSFEAWDARTDEKPALQIDVKVIAEVDHLTIQIEDNGCGFDAEQAKRLFVGSYSTKERSSGVGLVNCKRLANNTGVDVSLQSRGINQGATAQLSIPKELWI
jgi:light-regulated signal transduction histidine kinase (bacteriophytochrome)